jgi:hypothetical protein
MFDTNFGKPADMAKAAKSMSKGSKSASLGKGTPKGMKKGMVVSPAKTLGKGK